MKGEEIFQRPFVAFDNSALSHKILDIVEANKFNFQKVTILHVHKPQKLYIQISNRGPAVYNFLKQKFSGEFNPNIDIQLKQQGEKNTNVIILQNMLATSSSILFLGFVGSKGFKPRNKDLSSRIRQFVYESKINLAIIKTEDKKIGKVLFLFDGSEISVEGLNAAIGFCKIFKKQLSVLHAFNEDLKKYSKQVKLLLKTAQQQNKSIKFEQLFEQRSLIDSVKQKQNQYDWIIMNKNGYRGSISKLKFVGSNTTLILEQVNCNFIIIN